MSGLHDCVSRCSSSNQTSEVFRLSALLYRVTDPRRESARVGAASPSARHPRLATGRGRASSSSPGAGEEMKKGGRGDGRRWRSEKGGVIYHCLLSAGLPSSLQASAKWNRKDKVGARKKKEKKRKGRRHQQAQRGHRVARRRL